MGKKRIDIKLIPEPKQRCKAFLKRKRGLFKKAIELSLLCGVKVFLGIVNPDTNCTSIYQSEDSNIADIIQSLHNKSITKEFIGSTSYNSFLDPHYINLLKRNESEEIRDKKRSFRFFSTRDNFALLRSDAGKTGDNVDIVNNLGSSTAFPLKEDSKLDASSNVIKISGSTSTNKNKEEHLTHNKSLEGLKEAFSKESTHLSNNFNYQAKLIDELCTYSYGLINKTLQSQTSTLNTDEIEFCHWLRKYANSLIFDNVDINK